jgi:SHS2 domain-containing protein
MNDEWSSYREIEHTADLGVEVNASKLSALFSAAGEALFALIADPGTIEGREKVTVSASADGPEELLHAWLCELLGQFNIKGFIAKSCAVDRLTHQQIDGTLEGEKLDLSRHAFHTEIKGVTYHGFRVWEENGSWHARMIFDV